MLPVLLLLAALQSGQTAAATTPATAPTPVERWPLMEALQGTYPGYLLDGNRLRLYGWADMSFTASSVAHEQLPMGFNYRANEFVLQQGWARFELPIDTSATTPTLGFRTDTFFGTDYRFTVARGLFSGQLTADHAMPNLYGFDPIQLYAEAYLPQVGRGLDVKVGRFFAIYGFESNDATQNLLGSRSYCYIYNPFTHTGILNTLKLDDAWTVQAGAVTGSDVFIDHAARPTFIGSTKWAPPSGRDSVLFAVIVGPGRFEQERDFNNPEVFDLVYTHKFNDRLNYAADTLFGFQTNVPQLHTVTWFGAAQYLTFTFTPRLTGTVRLDFFDDAQGQRTGFKGLYSALTAGVTWKPHRAVWLRPEIRGDYNDQTRPYQGHHALVTAALDILLRW
jgi:hypothetical protein